MPNRLLWVQDSDDHWSVSFDAEPLCEVTRSRQFDVSSLDQALTGTHSSFESAAAQVQAWVRWSGR